MDIEKKSNLRAWLTVLGCGMLISGSVTFYTVVIGNFFVPASEALGSDYSSISLYSTLVYIGIACGLPFVGNWLPEDTASRHRGLRGLAIAGGGRPVV